MRLIDADALIECMDKRYKEISGVVPDFLSDGFSQVDKLIGEQPTAYDAGEVVEQLEYYLFHKYCVEGDKKIGEIIKGGGINE